MTLLHRPDERAATRSADGGPLQFTPNLIVLAEPHTLGSQMLSEVQTATTWAAAKVAAKPLVTDRPQPTPVEQTPSSEDCIDGDRHAKWAYGSEGWVRNSPSSATCRRPQREEQGPPCVAEGAGHGNKACIGRVWSSPPIIVSVCLDCRAGHRGSRCLARCLSPFRSGGCTDCQPMTWPCDRYHSHARHRAFTSCICRGVLQNTRMRSGLATIKVMARAREVATFNRWRSNRNSSPRGASAAEDVAME